MSTAIQRVRDDDFVECFLFPSFCYNNTKEPVSRNLLISEIEKFNKEIDKYTKDYMWHRDFLVFQPMTKNFILLNEKLQGATGDPGGNFKSIYTNTCPTIFN